MATEQDRARYEEVRATEGRIMGVDFGDARTGLALSDKARFLASTLDQISPGGLEKTAQQVAQIAFLPLWCFWDW